MIGDVGAGGWRPGQECHWELVQKRRGLDSFVDIDDAPVAGISSTRAAT